MGIEVHQIHNLVRTYQRALQPAPAEKSSQHATPHEDRVSVSLEARERAEQHSAIPEQGHENKKGSR